MEFRQLEVFSAVAEYKSFSKAADSLFLTQSTVSLHIKNLEKELQKSLILRTTKSLQLTEEGTRFLSYVQRILEMRDASLTALNGPSEHLLRLGASTIPSGYLLPSMLSSFQKKHPHTFFDIQQGDSDQIFEKIVDGSVELGFVGTDYASAKCVSVPFCTDELVLVTPATEHFLALKRQKCTLATLLKEPMILRESGSGTQKIADQYLESIHIRRRDLRTIAQVNDLESLKQMILKGMGISICSHFAIQDLEERGQVLVYPLPSDIHRNFYITYAKSRNLSPILREFLIYAAKFFH